MATVSVTPFSANVCGGLGSPKDVPQGNGRVMSCARRLGLLGFVYELRTKDKGNGELPHTAHDEGLSHTSPRVPKPSQASGSMGNNGKKQCKGKKTPIMRYIHFVSL